MGQGNRSSKKRQEDKEGWATGTEMHELGSNSKESSST